MRAITIKCPECGAVVNAKPTDASARCDYCGVTSQIRGRSRVLQIPQPMPAMPVGMPRMPVATARPNAVGCVVTLVVLGVIAGVAVPIVLFATKKIGVPAAVQKLREPQWDGASRPALMDIDGDGVEDVIGRVRIIQPTDVMKLGAFDGATGKRLWVSATLGPRGDWIHTPMGVTGGTIVVSDGKAGLVGTSVSDGSTKWTIRVNEVVKKICAGATEETLTIFTADGKAHALTVADGAVVPADAAECKPVPSDDNRVDTPQVIQWNWHNDFRELVPENTIEGMYAHEALYYAPGEVAIALGHKKPGSQVPMLAAYHWPDSSLAQQTAVVAELRARLTTTTGTERRAASTQYMEAQRTLRELEDARKPEVRWTAVIPGVDPLTARLTAPEPEHAAINGAYVFVVYAMKAGARGYRATAFGLADGARAWDIELPGTSPMSAVGISSRFAFVSRWDGLTAYDLTTGARAYAID